ncbi:hypothetical protein KEM48_013875 [Puccinia striiformis f. sp. tritici PST-130]|nr:hypothetical protein KEM48_013875 [Puccinia striiformis f. sp. tritici PST-130]
MAINHSSSGIKWDEKPRYPKHFNLSLCSSSYGTLAQIKSDEELTGVPISHLPRLISETKTDIQARKLKATMLGHVGDGNFHCIILFKDDDELSRVRECVHQMVKLAQDLDGTCTGEHGVGIGKIADLENELGMARSMFEEIKENSGSSKYHESCKLIP